MLWSFFVNISSYTGTSEIWNIQFTREIYNENIQIISLLFTVSWLRLYRGLEKMNSLQHPLSNCSNISKHIFVLSLPLFHAYTIVKEGRQRHVLNDKHFYDILPIQNNCPHTYSIVISIF